MSYDFRDFATPQGWECPKCHRVYSPSTFMCYYCGNSERYTTTTTGTSKEDIVSKLLKMTPQEMLDYTTGYSATPVEVNRKVTNDGTYTVWQDIIK